MRAETLAVWGAIVCLVVGVVWWVRSEWARGVAARVAVPVVVIATLLGLFVQLPERVGEVLIKVSLDPLRGVKQMLLMPTGASDPLFAQAWSIGNLFVLWPLAVVLLINARWSWSRVLVVCAAFDVACEAMQGSIVFLRRSFELADVVANLGGLAVLFVALRFVSRPVDNVFAAKDKSK